jgi:hypothetical protein
MWNPKSTFLTMVRSIHGNHASAEAGESPFDDSDVTVAKTKRKEGQRGGHKGLSRSLIALALLLSGGVTYAQYGYPQYNQPPPSQYPLMDEVADRFVQRYRQSSCEQLWQKREQPRSQREQEAIQALRNDPQMRTAFISRVAAPVANKMFECGMIP